MSEDTGSSDVVETQDYTPEESAEINELEEAVKAEPVIPKYKVKDGDIEEELTLEELIANNQQAKSSQRKYNEASRMKKQSEEFIRILKTDPRRVLEHPDLGIDLKAFARDYLAEQMENELLSPEQKDHKAMKQKLDQYEREQRNQQEIVNKQEEERYTKQYEESYTTDIIQSLKDTGLASTPANVSGIAKYLLQAMEAKQKNPAAFRDSQGNDIEIRAQDVAKYVKRDNLAQLHAVLGDSDEETLLNFLGDQISGKVVKAHLNKMKKGKSLPTLGQATNPSDGSGRVAPRKAMNEDEWKAMIAKKVRD